MRQYVSYEKVSQNYELIRHSYNISHDYEIISHEEIIHYK